MARTAKKKIAVYDEGVLLTEDADSIDFTGAGVVGSVIDNDVTEDIAGGGAPGTISFLDLNDTPDTYVGQALKFTRVNAAETGLEFVVNPAGFTGTEGSIPFVGPAGILIEDNENFHYFGDEVQLRVGPSGSLYDESPNDAILLHKELDDYLAYSIHNTSNGTTASAGFIVENDIDDGELLTGHYGEFGIVSSGYDSGDQLVGPNDIYLEAFGGHLLIQTYTPGKSIKFTTGGDTIDNIRATIEDDRMSLLANKEADITPTLVDANWDATNGWDVTAGTIVRLVDELEGTIQPSTPLTIGINTTYRVTIDVEAADGDITYTLGGEPGTDLTTGQIVDYITATSTDNFIITGAASATATITSILIEPLVDNTGDLLVEGNIILGSQIRTTTGFPVMNLSGSGVVTFLEIPLINDVPTLGNQATNKNYVDTLFTTGSRLVSAVQAATTENLADFTYTNGASGVGAKLTADNVGVFPTIDNVAPVLFNIYLIKDQDNPEENGAYVLTVLGDVSTEAELTRLDSYDTTGKIVTGTFFLVLMGDENERQQWALVTTGTVTVGTTDLIFEQLSAPVLYTASDGIFLDGQNFIIQFSASTPGLEIQDGGLRVMVDDASIQRYSGGIRVKAGGITNTMLAGSIADDKLLTLVTPGKVSGTALDNLQDIDSGAGIIPIANLASGVPNGTKFIRDDGTLAVPDVGTIDWGEIEGTLADQTDLVAALALKANISSLGDLAFEDTLAFEDLSNVIITAPQIGDVPVFNGTNWVNQPQSGGSGGSGVEVITVSGAIDDFNTTFTASEEPVLLNINGSFYQKTGGAYTWTYSSGTITVSAPLGTGSMIYGIRGSTPGSFLDSFGVQIDASQLGSAGVSTAVAFSGTIIGWTITADGVGSAVVDIKKASYTDYPTMTSITGSEKPTLSSSDKNRDFSLTTFTTSVTQYDNFQFILESVSGSMTKIWVTVTVARS